MVTGKTKILDSDDDTWTQLRLKMLDSADDTWSQAQLIFWTMMMIHGHGHN